MAKTLLYKADSRGISSSGWMYTKHTFCFADYYNTERIHFGALRVLNDMTIAPGKGLTDHSHSDIEVILLIMKGDSIHKDSLGNNIELTEGSVQVISSGSGYSHDEINKNADKSLQFLQFWIFPYKKNLTPNYSHKQFVIKEGKNKLQLLVSPNKKDNVTWIQQNSWLYITNLDAGKKVKYTLNLKENGVYILAAKGKIIVDGTELDAEDGIGIWETEEIEIKAQKDSQIIVIEVPMKAY